MACLYCVIRLGWIKQWQTNLLISLLSISPFTNHPPGNGYISPNPQIVGGHYLRSKTARQGNLVQQMVRKMHSTHAAAANCSMHVQPLGLTYTFRYPIETSLVDEQSAHNLATNINARDRLICSGTRLGAGQVQPTSGLVHPPLFIPHETSKGPFVYTGIGGWNSFSWNNKSIYY